MHRNPIKNGILQMANKTETDHSFKWFCDPFGMSHGTGLGPWPSSHSDSVVSAEVG